MRQVLAFEEVLNDIVQAKEQGRDKDETANNIGGPYWKDLVPENFSGP